MYERLKLKKKGYTFMYACMCMHCMYVLFHCKNLEHSPPREEEQQR